MDLILPFKKGDFAEARSFMKGFRGAWFRCKVEDMRVTKTGHLEYYLQYIDYPGDKKKWTRVFQKNPAYRMKNPHAGRQFLLRPPFPQLYQRDQVPEHFQKSNVVACVCDTWKVGDLIDWLSEDCYWTGKITKLLSEDKVEVELLEPPMGEGGYYKADCKDIRPALDWCLENDWTVPLSQANGQSWYTVQLIHHKSDTECSSSDEEATSDDDEEEAQESMKRASNLLQETQGSSNLAISSDTATISRLNNQKDTIATTMGISRPSSVSKPLNHQQATAMSNRSCLADGQNPKQSSTI
ncbi:hypothetical protein ABZP36_013591 [Zizania latifolia]